MAAFAMSLAAIIASNAIRDHISDRSVAGIDSENSWSTILSSTPLSGRAPALLTISQLEELRGDPMVIQALGFAFRSVNGGTGSDRGSMRAGFVDGSLEQLGARFAAGTGPFKPDQVALSHATAVRLYGSAVAAMGATLDIDEYAMDGADATVPFTVSGVMSKDFGGVLGESDVAIWMMWDSWRGTLLPDGVSSANAENLIPLQVVIDMDPAWDAGRIARVKSDRGLTTGEFYALDPGIDGRHEQASVIHQRTSLLEQLAVSLALLAVLCVIGSSVMSLCEAENDSDLRQSLGETIQQLLRTHLISMASYLLICTVFAWILAACALQYAGEWLGLDQRIRPFALFSTDNALTSVLAVLLPSFLTSTASLMVGKGRGRLIAAVVAFFMLMVVTSIVSTTLGCMRSLQSLSHSAMPFDTDDLWTLTSGYPDLSGMDLLGKLASKQPITDLTNAFPSDSELAWSQTAFFRPPSQIPMRLAGDTQEVFELPLVGSIAVSGNYFEFTGIPWRRGSVFDMPTQVVVNDAFVDRFLGDNANPLGTRLLVPSSLIGKPNFEVEIVGIVANAQYLEPGASPIPIIYRLAQYTSHLGSVLYRKSDADATRFGRLLSQTIQREDLDRELGQPQSLRREVSKSLRQETAALIILQVFTVLSLAFSWIVLSSLCEQCRQAYAEPLTTARILGLTRRHVLYSVRGKAVALAAIATMVAAVAARTQWPALALADLLSIAVLAALLSVGFSLLLFYLFLGRVERHSIAVT